jgi:pimeloyl-ACP methyl ester carboxylesterase
VSADAERSVAVGGGSFRYRFSGRGESGEPVLLLHPWFGCAAFWDDTVAGLSGRPRLALDLYSLGDGPWQELASPHGIAEAVLALIDAEEIDRFMLVGNSTGGVAAQIVAATRPDRVTTLVLVGTGASTDGVPADYLAEVEAWRRDDPDGSRSSALVRRLLSRDPPAERMTIYVEAVRRANRLFMVRTLEALLALDLRPSLDAISARTLVIRGTLDAARTRDHVRALLRGIRDSVAIELPGAGHSPMVDSIELFLPIVRAFLDGADVPGADRRLLTGSE